MKSLLRSCAAATALLCLLVAGGCASLTARAARPLVEGGMRSFESESDPALAREAVAAQLKLVDALLASSPGDRKLNQAAAKGFFAYAFLFVEDSDAERAKQLYLRGLGHALSSCGLDSGALEVPAEKFEARIRAMGKARIEPLFWTAACWAGWINLSLDDAQALSQVANLKILLARIQEWDPRYYYGIALVLSGALEAGMPKMLGGDMGRAGEFFDRAREVSGGKLLLSDYFRAKLLAVGTQDKKLFDRLTAGIAKADPAALPEQRLMNAVLIQKAAKLEKQASELFLEGEGTT